MKTGSAWFHFETTEEKEKKMSDEKKQRRLAWMFVLALIVLGTACVGQVQSLNHGAAALAPAQTLQKPSGRGMHEGIKVHGHWVIEVRKPDGKLISHTEFENSLFNPEATGLPTVFLGRTYTVGEWGILLGDSSSPPCTATGVGALYDNNNSLLAFPGPFCVLSEVVPPAPIEPENCAPTPDSGCSQNLQVSFQENGIGAFGQAVSFEPLTLTGTVLSVAGGTTVSQVQTILTECPRNVSAYNCGTQPGVSVGLYTFTSATLPQSNTPSTPCGGKGQISCAVNVPEAGDIITVTVTISFQ